MTVPRGQPEVCGQRGSRARRPWSAAGDRAIRLLRVARRNAMKARTQAGNQIHAVVDTAPAELRQRFVSRPTPTIVAEVVGFHRRLPDTPLEAARFTLRSLARRRQYLDDELTMLDAYLDELSATVAPTLRAMNGVGPQVATALLAAAPTSGCTRPRAGAG